MPNLLVPKEVQDLIRNMHPHLKQKIKASLRMILSDPAAGKALTNELSGLRSLPVSSFRIIYRIRNSEEIELVAIGPRERIYEETFRIIRREEKKPEKE